MILNILPICYILLALALKECKPQEDDDEGPYKGKLIGKLKSYHHQVSGEVYAVNDNTVLLVDFNYDGTGDDAFFWAGDTLRTGPQGFIVPDEHGKSNVLERYINAEVRLTLPEGRLLSKLKWFSVYDIGSQNVFGDVEIPEGWEAPSVRTLPALARDSSVAVSSGPVLLLDDVTILIKNFKYEGHEESYFWAGSGPQPSARGFKIPDERGYLEPLRAYSGVDLTLRLGGGRSLRGLGWLCVWAGGRSLASVLLPAPLDLPPAAARLHPHRAQLPNCRQLHRDYQLAWEVFGGQITIQLAAKIGPAEYMSFGLSGSSTSSRMVGADVVVAHYNETAQRGFADDYNITEVAPCVQVLGSWRGVCRDSVLGGVDSAQVFTASSSDGVTSVTYRRNLKPDEAMDREFDVQQQYVVWALGPLDHHGGPAYHRLTQVGDLALRFTPAEPFNDCFQFTTGAEPRPSPAWDTVELSDPATRVFDFRLGPAGGLRGPRGAGRATPALVWYVRGWMAPTLRLRRGLTYTFEVFGGKDPHSAALYHPLMVTPSAAPDTARLAAQAVPLLGLRATRRGFSAQAAGELCAARAPPHLVADDFPTFRQYNRSLTWNCSGARPYLLSVTPDQHWPDTVYYHSFTAHQDMGGKINIVDKYRKGGVKNSASTLLPTFYILYILYTLHSLYSTRVLTPVI